MFRYRILPNKNYCPEYPAIKTPVRQTQYSGDLCFNILPMKAQIKGDAMTVASLRLSAFNLTFNGKNLFLLLHS